jgi:hypothetical protein
MKIKWYKYPIYCLQIDKVCIWFFPCQFQLKNVKTCEYWEFRLFLGLIGITIWYDLNY